MDGIARERQVSGRFRSRGYLVASRRHEPGPGDLVAIPAQPSAFVQAEMGWWSNLEGVGERGLLVEVKATSRRFERFGPHSRDGLAALAEDYGLTPVLAWWPANGDLELIFAEDWPAGDVPALSSDPLAGEPKPISRTNGGA